jgi:hypothetical protein
MILFSICCDVFPTKILENTEFNISAVHKLSSLDKSFIKSQHSYLFGLIIRKCVTIQSEMYYIDLMGFYATSKPFAMDYGYSESGIFEEEYISDLGFGISKKISNNILNSPIKTYGGIIVSYKNFRKETLDITVNEFQSYDINEEKIIHKRFITFKINVNASIGLFSLNIPVGLKIQYFPDILYINNSRAGFQINSNICLLVYVQL